MSIEQEKMIVESLPSLYPLQEFEEKAIHTVLDALPSAQPETTRRIVGKSKGGMTLWYECERCGEPVDEGDKFCRGCGAKMEVTE